MEHFGENHTVSLSPLERVKAFTAFEPYGRWVRGYPGVVNEPLVDSKNVMLLWRKEHMFPIYAFPGQDVKTDQLQISPRKKFSKQFGEMLYYHHVLGEQTRENAAWQYVNPPEQWSFLKGYFFIEWSAMERWLEESEQVHVHARDPYHRVDVLPSSRKVEVRIGGETVAKSERAMFLFETGLPVRYYLPPEDVRTDLLEATALKTRCPYKGEASYWSFRPNSAQGETTLYENIVWSYQNPIEECPKIAGLLCFYNEKTDVSVGGVPEEKVKTPWS